jgi:hypothetical protein
MKRRNEVDVGPVQNGISPIFPDAVHKPPGCGESVEKTKFQRRMPKKFINFR